jgi:hypothetical protein
MKFFKNFMLPLFLLFPLALLAARCFDDNPFGE